MDVWRREREEGDSLSMEENITSLNDLGSSAVRQLGMSVYYNPARKGLDSVTNRGNWKLSPFEESCVRLGRSGWKALAEPTAHHEGAERIELALQRVAIEFDGDELWEI